MSIWPPGISYRNPAFMIYPPKSTSSPLAKTFGYLYQTKPYTFLLARKHTSEAASASPFSLISPNLIKVWNLNVLSFRKRKQEAKSDWQTSPPVRDRINAKAPEKKPLIIEKQPLVRTLTALSGVQQRSCQQILSLPGDRRSACEWEA